MKFTSGLLGALVLFAGTTSQAGVIFTPASLAAAEGANANAVGGLFGTSAFTGQIQIAASELAAQGLFAGALITDVAARLDGGMATGPSSNVVVSNLALTLAQAANTVAGMSTTFASNLLNPVTVYNASYTLIANSMPGGNTPNAFGAKVVFTTPYIYQGGDLVFEFTKPATTDTLTFDSTSNSYTGAGTLYQNLFALSQNATTGTLQNGLSIVAFDFTPVPEPAAVVSCGAGLAALAFTRRWLKTR